LSNDWNKFNPIAINRMAAIPEGNGYKLANAFSYDTKEWHIKNSKYIIYHFPVVKYYSDSLDILNNQFCENLIMRFGFKKPPQIELYVVDGVHEVGKLLGYDYYIYGNANGKSINNMIISGNKSIYYPHEIVHQFVNVNPKRNILLNEGFATYLGGNGGKQYKQLLKDYAKEYKFLKLDFEEACKGDKLNFYPLGAIIVDIIQSDYGDKKLIELMDEQTYSLDDLFAAIQKVTGLSKVRFLEKFNDKINNN